jgi:co-chaperonin GroES (HSP10)
MRSTYYILIEPLDGDEYANKAGSGLITNTSIEDHKSTQRLAKVVGVPHAIESGLSIGDIVLVHHNVFRSNYDMAGRLKKSNYMIFDKLYFVEPERVYMVIRDGNWIPFGPYTFIKPIKRSTEGYQSNASLNKEMIGEVAIVDPYFYGVEQGDVITFQIHSEYEFRLNDKVYYRVPTKNIVAVL